MTKFGIGQAVRRVEDQRFLTGAGSYVSDMELPRQCYGVAVLSPHAHAVIKSIDVAAARSAPGVVCVLTGADAAADSIGGIPPHFMPDSWGGPKGFATIRPVLLTDRVRCLGERVAFVVAETEAQARDAAELVQIDYEPLPSIVDIEAAASPTAAKIWEECDNGNIGATIALGDKAATDAAFAAAKYVAKLKLHNNRVTASAIEPRAAIGAYDAASGSYTLYTTSQDPHGVRSLLASAVFNNPESKIRVISPDVGGGFGMKANLYPDDVLVLWASKRCGRPVKWTATRSESLMCDTHARDQIVYGELALDEHGKILAVRAKAYQALGAYWWAAVTAPLFFSLLMIPSVYDIQTIDLSTNAVFTNTAPTSVYRGAGRPEAIYFIERMLDQAARVTGIDRVELRRRNLIKPGTLPYHTPTHQNYDSGEFERLMDRCLELADWNGFESRQAASKTKGKLRGRAVTPYVEIAGVFNDRMELRFDASGTLSIIAGTHSHGQGHATAFAQLVSEWLGVPFESIRYIQGDTEKVPVGRGTFAARSSMVGGSALRVAADGIIAKSKAMAGVLMEAAVDDIEFKDGNFTVKGTDKTIPLTAVAKAFFAPAGPVIKFGLGLDAAGSYSGVPGGAPNYPNGCQICEVEVDPETGLVIIDRFAAVDDLGMIINPLICEGQIQGGIAQGVGQALIENIAYDSSGQLVTGTFMDYGLPRAHDMPHIVSALEEVPAKTNPLGIKGIGESGTIGAPPTIVNAVLDALHPLGVENIDMPLTPLRVWDAIQQVRRTTAD
ncbi:xanthine dehydrogenase family protein molybdopterin-binding subunit [Pseudolabrys taiwanensis]|uniref:Xanthine dehydrogenase family protein molybdopterin-binding subunit n=1 Tax=Pseudolabrys taiwanensis TaxID=331696 RepID=A0A345ZYJ4_9HYPH|nr:xanthine dehydrogenase family protein molybdopterin-binding subunit [Pseudolabrys taiwanensis]AXK81991.1 xanthine dehydrogenase family protein molybdopterin-binding subunit [Pseudolabrys taiwanensis]